MEGRRQLGEITKMREEVIVKACELSMNAQKLINGVEPFLYYAYSRPSLEVVFAFAQSWFMNDWFSGSTPFGNTKIDLKLFPFLKSIGTEDIALVNDAFADRFKMMLEKTSLVSQVENAVKEGKKIVFAGHSSGGPMAILTTLWFLNKYTRKYGEITPLCVTFGSPLVGNHIFSHALRREKWARYFIHFVKRGDIIPLITLSPFSSIENELQRVLNFLNHKDTKDKAIFSQTNASTFLTTVLENASSVASYSASNLMGGKNLLVDTFSSLIDLSPYRPFGTFIFCNAHDKMSVAENSNVVLQFLFHFSKLKNDADLTEASTTRLNEHMAYEEVLKNRVKLQDLSFLDHPEETNWALNDLGLSRRVKLCLRAAEEVEWLKKKNQESLKKDQIKEEIKKIQDYQMDCEHRKLGYYDSFKLQNDEKDFKANVTRLELTGMWNEITEKLKNYELPDEFESQKDWIELGTQHRRLVEPLDVANYYRHGREEEAGTYLEKGRPRLYSWYTQRWLEPDKRIKSNSISESCFMAEVEDIRIISKKKSFEDLKERITSLEENILQWDLAKVLRSDVFLGSSTFSQWWNSLPYQHKEESCIRKYFIKI